MTDAEILKLSVETGLCDSALSSLDKDYVMTDYGGATDEVLAFARAILAIAANEAMHVDYSA